MEIRLQKIYGISIIVLLIFSNMSFVVVGMCYFSTKNQYLNNDFYDLLIITPSKFASYLKPLVQHKNKFGVRTILVKLNDVYDKMYWNGRDKQEKIKYFIKKALEEWSIDYVLLVGGRKNHITPSETWWLPVRYSYIEDAEYLGFSEGRYISDLYYADIYDKNGNFSSWDTNGNGIFSEWYDNKSAEDISDLYPDVYLGRLPCRNGLEIKIMVNKIITYEKEKCSESWFRNMVVAGGDTTPTEEDHYEGEYSNQLAIDRMQGFNHIRLWTSWGTLTGQKDVIKAINYGCGFLYLAGHGGPWTWHTYPPKDNTTRITGLNLQGMWFLSNKKKLPITVVGGCHNSLFNISLLHSSWTFGNLCTECWSWRLTRKIGGGSIAVISNTAFSYGPENRQNPNQWAGEDRLEVHFFEEYGVNGTDVLGEAWGKTITSYLDHLPIHWNERSFNDSAMDAKTVQQWILIGDPSLKIGGYPP
ncbi:MAG: hypothetical protein JSW60_07555 [Thermoplasmatales archaeon]|nr:MAG: hypothetical protein JSW60_07555 [Thermoplasmatales archaeon]